MRLAAALLAEARQGPWPPLLLASLTGWIALLLLDQWFPLSSMCLAGSRRLNSVWWEGSLLAMVMAMMAPLLAGPMRHLWSRSLSRRRVRAIAVFVLAYGAAWMAAATVLALVATGVRAADGPLLVVAVVILALLWQLSPAKQQCLKLCHRLPRLAAFGWNADRDCLRYGLANALWCIGSCWALMLLSMLVDGAHLAVAVSVAVLLAIERQAPARWRLPFTLNSPRRLNW
jgi:predicted metal-binding membrane protein